MKDTKIALVSATVCETSITRSNNGTIDSFPTDNFVVGQGIRNLETTHVTHTGKYQLEVHKEQSILTFGKKSFNFQETRYDDSRSLALSANLS